MSADFLQNILKAGLFEIGDSDNRLEWLKSSITDLEKKLNEDNSLIPTYTLVALDPNISDTEPVLIDTEKIIVQYWEALRVRYNEMPCNIIRGVILNALYNIGLSNSKIARIVYLTATNYYPYAKLNSEKKLIEQMLLEFGEIAEKVAVEEWSLTEEEPSLKLTPLKITDFKFGTVTIDKSKISTQIKDGATASGYNPYHNAEQWGTHLATKTSAIISETLENAFDSFSKSITPTTIETPINKFFTEFKKSLDIALKSSFSSITAVERRSKLLWWKETLYSTSLKGSYRNVDKNALPIIMASDLYYQVPAITPISVDYLLKDTLYLLNDKKDDSITFATFLTAISKNELKELLKSYFENIPSYEGKLSITDFLALLLNDRVNVNQFKERTGIDSKEKITHTDFSVTIFHDLLVQYLIK